MRKLWSLAAGAAALALVCASAQAASLTFKAALNGASEVPPTNSSGTGSATVTVDNATKKVSWTVQYSGLSGPATAAHIHCGAAPGANAGVAVPLTGAGAPPASPLQGSATMTDAQLSDLTAGRCYVNIHTDANKGGEIRGQLAQAQ
ncbi:MAG: CHRD domain-containing protein [Alphaproteobacteria bacterium]|nr:CHRD domain-containing protein [Alphaproteobacteria bacterium]